MLKHVVVLMLENRSFDHVFGHSSIKGTDATTHQPTEINNINNHFFNELDGKRYEAKNPAPWTLPVDPGHEMLDIFTQICGLEAQYDEKLQYNGKEKPMSGFVYNYVHSKSKDEGEAKSDFGAIMRGFTPEQLPILNQLAREFVICDNYFCSAPLPTWPNRLFALTGTSWGLDDSPTEAHILQWEAMGLKIPSIFDSLSAKNIKWKIYGGHAFPIQGAIPLASALHHVWSPYDQFERDLQNNYEASFTFIEPNYGDTIGGTYSGGTSMHPLDDVRGGERLIKHVYESLRKSPIWESSLLLITWDEHGGFFDHVPPPSAVPPDSRQDYSTHHFRFDQLGVRVPALIVSPLIPHNLIDHTLYDHTSMLNTLEHLMGLEPLTERDKHANNFLHLVTLGKARECPSTLHETIDQGKHSCGWKYLRQRLRFRQMT
jgi:phospholipase C